MVLEHDAHAESLKTSNTEFRSFRERTDAFLELAKALAKQRMIMESASGEVLKSGNPQAPSESVEK